MSRRNLSRFCPQIEGCKKTNLVLEYTEGEGDCLYHAIARILNEDDTFEPLRERVGNVTVNSLREEVAFRIHTASPSFINRNRIAYLIKQDEPWFVNAESAHYDNDEFRKLWILQTLGNAYGDETTLQILSEIYFISFLVLYSDCRNSNKGVTYNPDCRIIALLQLSALHYQNIYRERGDGTKQYVFSKNAKCVQSFGKQFQEEYILDQ